jgi:hypothetical protein
VRLTATVTALTLAGCQSAGYEQYARAMADIAESRASVQRAQMVALTDLARSGDTTARTVAVIMLGLGAGGGGFNGQYTYPAPPQNEALQWAQVLLPTVATLGLGYWGYRLGTHQSDNAANVSIAGYGAMQGIAQSGFNAVGQFKPIPFDWSKLKPDVTITTNITNDDGLVVQGQGNRGTQTTPTPVVVVPPVTIVPPVVVTNP